MRAVGNHFLVRCVARHVVTAITLTAAIAWLQTRASGAASDSTKDQPAAASGDYQNGRATPAATSDSWRYKWHDGLWWYWTVADHWVYWVDDRWVDYDPSTYATFRASRATRTASNSRGGQSTWGPWGPIRYDRFGNRQYPYSQRKHGLQQLGPVPTPAGLRSLPGWGGER